MNRVLLLVLPLALWGCVKTRLLSPSSSPRFNERAAESRGLASAPDVYDVGIGVSKKGFFVALGGSFLTADGALLPKGAPRPDEPTVPAKDGQLDFTRLAELIAVLKQKHPTKAKVTFASEGDMSVADFLDTVEKVRSQGGDALFPQVIMTGDGSKK